MAHPFEYQKPTEEHVQQITEIRQKCAELYDLLNEIPNGRERSLAITKLEEVSMWANKAVVFAQTVSPDGPGVTSAGQILVTAPTSEP